MYLDRLGRRTIQLIFTLSFLSLSLGRKRTAAEDSETSRAAKAVKTDTAGKKASATRGRKPGGPKVRVQDTGDIIILLISILLKNICFVSSYPFVLGVGIAHAIGIQSARSPFARTHLAYPARRRRSRQQRQQTQSGHSKTISGGEGRRRGGGGAGTGDSG